MIFTSKDLDLMDAKLIYPESYPDDRGFYMETFSSLELGTFLKTRFVQDNMSYNKHKYTFRGFHYQEPPYTQAKLVRVVKGQVLDMIIDLRGNSPTFMQYTSVVLDDSNKTQLFAPEGFGHAFLTLEDDTIFEYKVSTIYNKESSVSFRHDLLVAYKDKDISMSDTDVKALEFDIDDNPFKDWNCNERKV